MQNGKINAILMTAATLSQAVVAVFLLIVIIRQTEIIAEQKDISRRQDEFSKFITVRGEYDTLSASRRLFWESLAEAHDVFQDPFLRPGVPSSLDELIRKSGFPLSFDPSKVTDLLEFVNDRKEAWDTGTNKMWIWEFARCMYPKEDDLSDIEGAFDSCKFSYTDFDKARSDLADFWDKWSSLLDIRDYLQPDRKELIMLTWLELALVRRAENSGEPGKTSLFKLAQQISSEHD